jgi:hypothetical protein
VQLYGSLVTRVVPSHPFDRIATCPSYVSRRLEVGTLGTCEQLPVFHICSNILQLFPIPLPFASPGITPLCVEHSHFGNISCDRWWSMNSGSTSSLINKPNLSGSAYRCQVFCAQCEALKRGFITVGYQTRSVQPEAIGTCHLYMKQSRLNSVMS